MKRLRQLVDVKILLGVDQRVGNRPQAQQRERQVAAVAIANRRQAAVDIVGPAAVWVGARRAVELVEILPRRDARSPGEKRNRVIERIGVEAVIQPFAAMIGRKDDRGLAFESLVGRDQLEDAAQVAVDRFERVDILRAAPGSWRGRPYRCRESARSCN